MSASSLWELRLLAFECARLGAARERYDQEMELLEHLQEAWCSQTSSDPGNWSPENPSWGQCAVTALVIQDLFGGELLRSTVGGISHYWNSLPDGTAVDLTGQQFESGSRIDRPPVMRPREYVLAYEETKRRYLLLRERMALQPDNTKEGT